MTDSTKLAHAMNWAAGLPGPGGQSDHVPVLMDRIRELEQQVTDLLLAVGAYKQACAMLEAQRDELNEQREKPISESVLRNASTGLSSSGAAQKPDAVAVPVPTGKPDRT